MTGATRQQRGETATLNVRIPPELADWLREYSRSEGISLNMAAAQILEAGRTARMARVMVLELKPQD